MISDKFVILGAVINLIGTSSYILHTLQGRTRPNRISWAMWSLAPLVAFAAELGKGVGLQSLMTFMSGFCPLLVLVASFVNRKSYWKLSQFDIMCGVLSVLGLFLWLITKQGNVAIVFSIMADALAALPTIVKSYKDPESESWYAFGAAAISAALTLLSIDNWTFANYGFPIYILSICVAFVLLIKYKVGLKLIAKNT